MGMYYNTIIGWAVYYLYASFTYELPWTSCSNEWNTPFCKPVAQHANLTNATSPAREFFEWVVHGARQLISFAFVDSANGIRRNFNFVFALTNSLWRACEQTKCIGTASFKWTGLHGTNQTVVGDLCVQRFRACVLFTVERRSQCWQSRLGYCVGSICGAVLPAHTRRYIARCWRRHPLLPDTAMAQIEKFTGLCTPYWPYWHSNSERPNDASGFLAFDE